MNFVTKALLVCAFLMLCQSVNAQCDCEGSNQTASPTGQGGYLPEELQTPVYNSRFVNNGITTGQVEALMERFRDKFPDIKFTYVKDKVEVNAVAFGDGVTFPRNVELWGGMAKHPAMKLEGIALILAHEAGHHYGNSDNVATNPTDDSEKKKYPHGAYCEDQSDFWATRVGLRIVYNGLDEFTNAHYDGTAAYDWNAVDQGDSTEYQSKCQTGIEQAYSLLSGGLFVPADTYLNAVTSSYSNTGCGHPLAGCRKALYESGKLKSPRAVCTPATGYAPSDHASNAKYIYDKYGIELHEHGFDETGTSSAHAVGSSPFAQSPDVAAKLAELANEIKALRTELQEVKSKVELAPLK